MTDLLDFDDDNDQISLQKAWDNVLRRLQQELPQAWFDRFIRPLRPCALDGTVATIAAPGRFVLEWVRERFQSKLEAALSDEIGFPITIDLEARPSERTDSGATSAVKLQPERVGHSSFRPNEKFSFESYVVGQSNRLAVAGAKAVATQPGVMYNPLFIYGSSGLGKTHLLHAIARETIRSDNRYPLAYVTAQQFAEDFVNALQTNRVEQFRRNQRGVGMWLVDDIQFVVGKDKTQEEIFHTFNYLQSLGKQIVLTSDRPPKDLYHMDERLRSRFEAGLVADVQMPDTETRSAILLSKAGQENLALGHDVAMHLAEHVPGNIRVLEGALTKLVAIASVEGEPITLPLAQRIVELYYRSGSFAKPGFEAILGAVGKHYKISSDEIRSPSRKAPVVHARHVAVFIARELTGDSWKHIGGLFDKDHTSVMHGYQKISELMQDDKDLKATVTSLMRKLYPEA